MRKYIDLTCAVCDKLFQRELSLDKYQRKVRSVNYRPVCSHECVNLLLIKLSEPIKINCDFCGKEFERAVSEVDKATNHYCSNSCSGSGKVKLINQSENKSCKCTLCGIDLVVRANVSLLKAKCAFCRKKCAAENASAKYRSDESIRERKAKNKLKPERRIVQAKYNAKIRELDWDISIEDYEVLVNRKCHYCKNYFATDCYTGVGLDRINNELGYTLLNVIPCCYICNMIRGCNLSVEEAEVAIKALLKFHKKNKTKMALPSAGFHKKQNYSDKKNSVEPIDWSLEDGE